ncbi:Mannose-6-phosphate isomerase [Methanosarcina lacustris Z-7289]|uniref:Mannose-6-phosphate isomerase n=1 Tax=Methanosarcina lacustris Z-7289 TaxID=1434111 RepID=A0A0E3S5C6_9EURY|nr:cupin domain-containing protein [Methanosarcina lacustris]AKB75576.1 Mannose-6-phosphate isomerase [Methanosarcina lacustris Z-7289]
MPCPLKPNTKKIKPSITKDGSIIRELMHPAVHGNSEQNLSEATVPVGGKTFLHKHRVTEEIYHITEGSGIMALGFEEFEVRKGDSIRIPPGTPHGIRNTGKEQLKILCCCAPAYSHEDTELMG